MHAEWLIMYALHCFRRRYWIYTLIISTYCMNKRGFNCAVSSLILFYSSIFLFSTYLFYPGSLSIIIFFLYPCTSRTPYLLHTSALPVCLLHHYTKKFSWQFPHQKSFLFYFTYSHPQKFTWQLNYSSV